MIKLKISDLVNGTEALQKLSNTELKARLSWQVAKLLKAAEQEMQDFNQTRMELIKKYGEKDENGELITDDNGNCKIIQKDINDFTAELDDLIKSEIEINANPIQMKDLEDKDFTPAEMLTLEPFISVDEE